MARKESKSLVEYLAVHEEERMKAVREGIPGAQKRLREMVLHKWGEMLAIKQTDIPQEIHEIIGYKVPRTAATVLWMSPSVSDIEILGNIDIDSVSLFVQLSQSSLWEAGEKNDVIKNFQTLAEDSSQLKHKTKIPTEIRYISPRLNESVLQTIWRMPSPWLWGFDERDEALDIRRSPSGMWRDNDRQQVINYMRVVADNIEYLH